MRMNVHILNSKKSKYTEGILVYKLNTSSYNHLQVCTGHFNLAKVMFLYCNACTIELPFNSFVRPHSALMLTLIELYNGV